MVTVVARVDIVYHLAAAVGVKLIIDAPVKTIETNVPGTELVLQPAPATASRTVLASTSEVYGKGRPRSSTRAGAWCSGRRTAPPLELRLLESD